MPIRFERQEKVARYLDPRRDFAETAIHCEERWDTLTGRSGRVAHAVAFQLPPLDVEPLIAASRPACPFCPERVLSVTPKFLEEFIRAGRLQRGEAVLFPNLLPYDEHSAVAAMCQAHYVPMGQFSVALLRDAFGVCLEYLRQMQRFPRTDYALVFWNYFPASGGTQIHPHLQVFATDAPGNALIEELACSQRYLQDEGRVYWADLLEEEERLGERFVARGKHSAWLSSFVSKSLLSDTLILFPERYSLLDLSDEALDEFCQGLTQTLQLLAAQGVYSFNLAWFASPAGGKEMWLHARLSPRLYLTPRLWGVDTTTLQHLYQEHFMVRTPEAWARDLQPALTL